jgi:hypothetical protein
MKPITTVTHMKNRLYLTIILMALLLSGIVQIAVAQDIVAGVKRDDQFTYSVTGSYSNNAPITDVPEEVLSAQATEFFKVTIVNVTGPEIWYDWFWSFNNGSAPLTNTSMLDIETLGNTGPFWPIVSANLTAGERIHPHYGPDLSTFNETIMYAYTNYTRETNRFETQSAEQNNASGVTRIRNVHRDAYFDKQTGMLVQLNEDATYQSPAFTSTLTWKLIGQNVWTFASAGSYPPAPFFSLPVIIAIVVVVAVVVAIGVWALSNRRTKARRKELLKKK